MPTAVNLQAAFAGESQANRKYLAFAAKADAEGHPQIAKLFRAAAAAETVHAHAHLRVMGGIKDTKQNLQAAIEGEGHEFKEMYPAFIREAEAEGTQAYPVRDYSTGLRCRKRGCTGPIRATVSDAEEAIVWYCPSCLDQGVIRNWQGTKWDQRGNRGDEKAAARDRAGPLAPSKRPAAKYTPKEGQYLAFIYYYAKLHRQAPSEHDMQVYFQVTPPTVHDMVLKLEKQGFISREPGMPRSIRLLLSRDRLPDLQ